MPVVTRDTAVCGRSVRARLDVRGAVQGVGFRPFVYRLAVELGLTGWVLNSSHGVQIEVEGPVGQVDEFQGRVRSDRPPRSSIHGLETVLLDPAGYTEFEIRGSDEAGEKTAVVPPDIATCVACREEIFDSLNRRFAYPFTNCTNCGPRYSIIEALPYDRPHTSMRGFTMCERCQAEYDDPLNRRFHAQPNACPACGPHLELLAPGGGLLTSHHAALTEAIRALREGAIVAAKGIGGYQLLALAGDTATVERLRARKHREEKPFALMFPSLQAAREQCEIDKIEERLLLSPESPIVLLRRRGRAETAACHFSVCEAVAPANPYLGVMLPYSPLHHLLLSGLGVPVVATSGNLSDEPICTGDHEAIERLDGIADLFLVHNRPIVRHVDDSIARVILGRELVLRRARGYAPLPVWSAEFLPPILAVGGHLKNTVALARGHQVFISQHIGDLETAPALAAFDKVIDDLQRLHEVHPEVVAVDAHPDYISAKRARSRGGAVSSVQHHYAHVLSCMAENELPAPLLGVSWDGTGYGDDGAIWGGEFLRITHNAFARVGHLRTFRLPGGDQAVREPRRAGLGLLYAIYGEDAFSLSELPPLKAFTPAELKVLHGMLVTSTCSPETSSAGRLFDAVASITGLRQHVGFEGQAAMDLEFAFEPDDSEDSYPLPISRQRSKGSNDDKDIPSLKTMLVLDWGPMILRILEEMRRDVPVWIISARFHNALAEAIVSVARRVKEPRVVLTGGCFQNKYLLESAVLRLRSAGFDPYWHQRVPPNDGGIALGQVLGAARARLGERRPCV